LPEILKKLSSIAEKEKINIDPESLEMISEAASGGMRDAESLLAQVASLAGKEIKSSETRGILGIAGRDDEVKLLTSLLDKNISQTADRLEQMNNDGMDMFLLSHRLLDYLRKMIFIKLNPRGSAVIEQEISKSQVETLKNLAAKITVTELLILTSKIIQSQPSIKNSSFPHLPLELAVVEWGLKDNGNSEISSISREEPVDKQKLDKPEEKETKDNETKVKETKIKKADKKVEKNAPSADLKTVLAKWTTVLQNVRQLQPALFSLLKVCSPVRIEDDVLIITTPFKFHKDKLNDGKNRSVFCQELKKEVGISRICVVQDNSLPNNKVNDDEMLDQVKSLLAS
jgi:DNA polymerase III subunit gamma/tau